MLAPKDKGVNQNTWCTVQSDADNVKQLINIRLGLLCPTPVHGKFDLDRWHNMHQEFSWRLTKQWSSCLLVTASQFDNRRLTKHPLFCSIFIPIKDPIFFFSLILIKTYLLFFYSIVVQFWVIWSIIRCFLSWDCFTFYFFFPFSIWNFGMNMGFLKDANKFGFRIRSKEVGVVGISVRSLKPINMKPKSMENEDDDADACSTTKEARILKKLSCSPAPRKRPPSRCNNNFNGIREYFTPPNLETMFKLHVEKAINLEPLCWWWWHTFGHRWGGLSDGESDVFSISDFRVKIHEAQSPIYVFCYASPIWFPHLSLDFHGWCQQVFFLSSFNFCKD